AMAPNAVPARKRRRLSGVSCCDMGDGSLLSGAADLQVCRPALSLFIQTAGWDFFSIQDRPPSTSPPRRGTSARMNEPLTLIDKLWTAHEITRRGDGAALLWVDRHYVHEGAFHAFTEMQARGGTVAEPDLTFAVADHYAPTRGRAIADPEI